MRKTHQPNSPPDTPYSWRVSLAGLVFGAGLALAASPLVGSCGLPKDRAQDSSGEEPQHPSTLPDDWDGSQDGPTPGWQVTDHP